MRARPTLSVTVDSTRAGTRPASIRYLTPGLGWAADYVALYDEGKGTIDMQGWVTLTNNTGTTFNNANTLLVAGSPGSGNDYAYRSRQPSRSPGSFTPGTAANWARCLAWMSQQAGKELSYDSERQFGIVAERVA